METRFVEQARLLKEQADELQEIKKSTLPRLTETAKLLKTLAGEIQSIQASLGKPSSNDEVPDFDKMVEDTAQYLDKGNTVSRPFLQNRFGIEKMQAYYLLTRVKKEVGGVRERKEGKVRVLYKPQKK